MNSKTRTPLAAVIAVLAVTAAGGVVSADPTPSSTPGVPTAPVTVAPGVTISPKDFADARARARDVYITNMVGKSLQQVRDALNLSVRVPIALNPKRPVRLHVLPEYPGSSMVNPSTVRPADLVVVDSLVYAGTLELAVVPTAAAARVAHLPEAVEASKAVPFDVMLTLSDENYGLAYSKLIRASDEARPALLKTLGVKRDARGLPEFPGGYVLSIAVQKN
ncbi:hypothetical protein [Tsukamurella spumae]|uniref:Uncharacterized protein n=1 Tax=Tsukamurella spumae TaxID=44753 RepID=A0A846X898_9ACTN|nr:hypothetical protein [Tsukamurella spumae]NKY20815.1 hypothetical protein [Tsukamurella spumae]